MNKKKILFIIFILIIFFSLFLYLKEKNYYLNYNVNGFEINESYNKKTKLYYFKITKDNLEYDFSNNSKYISKRKLITNISNDESCLYLKGDIKLYNICKNDNYYIKFKNSNNNITNNYKKIQIYDLMDNTYFIWNYKGFIILNKDYQKEIELLKKDIYIPSLITVVNNKIFMPNYENEYKFDNYFLITKKGKYKNKKLKNNFYFDSEIISVDKNIVYLKDNKENKNYLINTKINKTKIGTLKEKEEYFKLENNTISYYLNDLIITTDVDYLVKQNKDTVYYIKKGVLYSYNLYDGECIILAYDELLFNYKNIIYIINNQ